MKNLENKKALYNYAVEQTIKAGLELTGNEVKSLRKGMGSLQGSYCVVRGGEAFLVNAHIPVFQGGADKDNVDTRRTRRLLLNKKEIAQLLVYDKAKGFATLPIMLYTNSVHLKLDIGICKNKNVHDKRQILKEKAEKRKISRVLKTYRNI